MSSSSTGPAAGGGAGVGTGSMSTSTMQLEFGQAMSDFKTMFPEMEEEVIEAVLRANQGGVDATIDQLLTMSTDNQNERLRHQMEKESPSSNTPQHTNTPEQNKTPRSEKQKPDQIPLRVQFRWKPPLLGPLPANFLRLPDLPDHVDLEDEKIALYLQNEEFLTELRWNQDFLHALDKEQGKVETKKGQDEEADFKERLRNMGKLSRKKFAQLTRVFNWQGSKRGGPSGTSGGGGLLQEEHSDDEDKPPYTATK